MVAPAFPAPPDKYSREFMAEFLRALRLYFNRQVDVKDPVLRAFSTSQTITTGTTSLGVVDGGVILANTTGGNVAVILPAASLSLAYQFIIKRITGGANTCVITATSGNIDGGASASISTQYTSMTFRSDGTNYWIV